VLAKINKASSASARSAPTFATKADWTAVKGELEAVFTAYKASVRGHMKVLLADEQWQKYDTKVVLGKFQGDQELFGEAKRQIRSLRKAAELQAANE